MALSRRQQILYTHLCDVWRPARAITSGKPADPVYTRIATDVSCYFQTDSSLDQPRVFGRSEHDILFTLDEVHFDRNQDVDSEDVLVNKTLDQDGSQSTHYGRFWVIRGRARSISHQRRRRAGKKQFYAVQSDTAPTGVTV